MPRPIHRLTVRQVATLKSSGRHADGGGLYLRLTDAGAKSWVFMTSADGKRAEIGLGPASSVSLATARGIAADMREAVATGRDPSIVFRLRDDLKRTHIAHACIKFLCFALADQGPGEKREAEGLGVNYVGINEWCGALDYKVTARGCSLLPINRRDIADDIRAITDGPVPSDCDLANFDDFVRGRPLADLRTRSAHSSDTDQVSILGAT